MKKMISALITVVFLFGFTSVASAQTIEKVGDIGQIAIPATALTLTALKGDKKGAIELMGSVLVAQAITHALKASVDATRPNGGKHSFPSGHTSAAFAGASFLQKRYGWRYGAPAYAAAALVGWTRVESKNHYARDVAVGALIGTGVSQFLTRPLGKRLTVAPTIGDGVGIVASIDLR